MPIGRADYEERKQEKIERLSASAEKAQAESTRRYQTAHTIGEHIPFGQPILVGHHSEAHARRDADKIFNNMQKSVEAQEKASYYAGRAAAVESNTAISSDDPNSIKKLTQKLEMLLDKQAFMKKVNTYYRKHKTCKGVEGLTDEQAQKLDDSMKTAHSWETAPYPSFKLTNNNAKIKATRERIEKLKTVDAMLDEVIEFDGGRIVSDSEINRVQIVFDERQPEAVTERLQRNGFHWSPSEKAWQRLRNPGALRVAKLLVEGRDPM